MEFYDYDIINYPSGLDPDGFILDAAAATNQCQYIYPGSSTLTGWKTSNNGATIRFDVSRGIPYDVNGDGCSNEGTCDRRQVGYATASITVGNYDTLMTLDFNGVGETWTAGYDYIEFKLDGVSIGYAEAAGGEISTCSDGPVKKTFYDMSGTSGTSGVSGTSVSNPYTYLLAAGSTHILSAYFDTADPYFHNNSYYVANVGFNKA